MLVGTPAYLAPKRLTEAALLDPRSDLFSLGVTVYELLVGRKPFSSDDTCRCWRGSTRGGCRAPTWPILRFRRISRPFCSAVSLTAPTTGIPRPEP